MTYVFPHLNAITSTGMDQMDHCNQPIGSERWMEYNILF